MRDIVHESVFAWVAVADLVRTGRAMRGSESFALDCRSPRLTVFMFPNQVLHSSSTQSCALFRR
jgi:hypothetical protein